MAQELGESIVAWANDVFKLVEDFAANMKSEVKPFYIVYAAKQDRFDPRKFRQSIKAYYKRPSLMFGILVWYVDNSRGILEFVPELSAPPDIPLDSALLSENSSDELPSIMEKGKQLGALLS